MLGALGGDHAENVGPDPVLFQQPVAAADPAPSALLPDIYPVQVVKIFGAVQRKTYQKIMLFQKNGPVFIQQSAVGLERIGNGHIFDIIFFDLDYKIPEKIQSSQGGFAALKTEGDFPVRRFKGPRDHLFKGFLILEKQ